MLAFYVVSFGSKRTWALADVGEEGDEKDECEPSVSVQIKTSIS